MTDLRGLSLMLPVACHDVERSGNGTDGLEASCAVAYDRAHSVEPLSHAHSAGMFAMWSRVEVCEFAGPVADFNGDPVPLPAIDASASDKIIDFFVRSAAAGTRFRWALLGRPDGAFVGAVGFNSRGPCSEIAYHMLPEYWGRGLMTEAALAAIDWLRGRAGSETVEALIDEGNAPSIKLALRLGMRATRESAGGAHRYSMSLHVR